MKKVLKKGQLAELLKDIVLPVDTKKRNVKIIFDGKQTSIRIPLEFVEAMEIDPKKDSFEFEIKFQSPTDEDNKPKLYGRLIKNA